MIKLVGRFWPGYRRIALNLAVNFFPVILELIVKRGSVCLPIFCQFYPLKWRSSHSTWTIPNISGKDNGFWRLTGRLFPCPTQLKIKNATRSLQEQKAGCGFPSAGFVAAVSLSTGVVLFATLGKQCSHDLKLFYHVRSCFLPGDVFLADRGFCSYAELALFKQDNIDSVVRLNSTRKLSLSKIDEVSFCDHVEYWNRPKQRPQGLSQENYNALPLTLQVRVIKFPSGRLAFGQKRLPWSQLY